MSVALTVDTRPPPARYFPLESGRYEVAPGLRRLGTDYGNGPRDGHLIQLDRDFERYRANKLACRAARPGSCVLERDYTCEVAAAVARLLAGRLAAEHPHHFRLHERPDGFDLDCRLTSETLGFDGDGRLRDAPPGYEGALDALACQMQEDLAVVSTDGAGRDWLSALHVCAPSHWRPAEKIGLSFTAVHDPVPGIQRVNQAAPELLKAMVTRGPFVRFVWGVSARGELDLHPDPPPGGPAAAYPPPCTEGACPYFLRVERQVLWGLPEVDAALFAIRLYVTPLEEVRADPARRDLLRRALLGMSLESRAYKGLTAMFDPLLAWLSA